MTTRVVVLLSGRGSNLAAILTHVRCGQIPATVVGVISNRPGAGGLAIARSAGITAACIDHRLHADRSGFETVLATTIDALQPDLILLAGFMRVLTPAFVERYSPRLLNVHPSLLPEHRGLDTHARALARGDREHGASVHVVVPELDAGPVIAQVAVPIRPEDDVAQLAARVQRGEHLLYPRVLEWYATGRLQLDQAQVRLDGRPLPERGARFRLVMANSDNAAAAGDTLEVA